MRTAATGATPLHKIQPPATSTRPTIQTNTKTRRRRQQPLLRIRLDAMDPAGWACPPSSTQHSAHAHMRTENIHTLPIRPLFIDTSSERAFSLCRVDAYSEAHHRRLAREHAELEVRVCEHTHIRNRGQETSLREREGFKVRRYY